ncbi:hypothetical protein CTAYLR_010101 [Chrysophaeum taylorii]|uniref:DUS-like FMN-binding domain-containing protein n=1 Tax=Chrysophaeum taylorii TaxID=2483200 RepID=A0AAD7U6M9_9STRA|nr:hypothetical protein CTAYLR_010101 [Chrysophaeum taylorii]
MWPPPPPRSFGFGSDEELWVGLAPMVRANSAPLRALAARYGASVVYSEELIAKRLASTQRVWNDALGTVDFINGAEETIALRTTPGERLVVQVGAADAGDASAAARQVAGACLGVDLNMGCPKAFSTSGGMGAALLRDPARAADCVRAMRRTGVVVSAKIRLAENFERTVDVCRAVQAAGAEAIAVHCRFVDEQPPRAPPRHATQRELFQRLRSEFEPFRTECRLIANGDFYARDAAAEACRGDGAADGVIVGRPALLNCSIFRRNDDPLPRLVVLRDYVAQCRALDVHHKNAKYVIMEMLAKRRHPKTVLRLDPLPPHISISNVAQCRSLDDIETLVCGGAASSSSIPGGALPDARRYDDAYFLPPNKKRSLDPV